MNFGDDQSHVIILLINHLFLNLKKYKSCMQIVFFVQTLIITNTLTGFTSFRGKTAVCFMFYCCLTPPTAARCMWSCDHMDMHVNAWLHGHMDIWTICLSGPAHLQTTLNVA